MEKRSVRQFSLLGLVLMGASALTAAIVPSKAAADDQVNTANNGTLRFNSGAGGVGGVQSCVTVVVAANCHKTATGAGLAGTQTGIATVFITINGTRYTTRGNTSITILNNGIDTTSILTAIL